jgi:SAM-dependent methyltransferase
VVTRLIRTRTVVSSGGSRLGTGTNGGDAVLLDQQRVRSAYERRGVPPRESLFEEGDLFLNQDQTRAVLACMKRHAVTGLANARLLEIGCGTGYWLREFVQWDAKPSKLFGVDVLSDRIERARGLCAAKVSLALANAASLPFRDNSFDIVFQSTVFTSILDPRVRKRVAGEMIRVVQPRGVIIWYDFFFDNPRNADVRAVGRRELGALFKGCEIESRRITLLPPLARVLARYSWVACRVLNTVPFLRTHILAVIRPGERQRENLQRRRQ